MIEEHTVTELKLFDSADDEVEVLRLVTNPRDLDFPVKLRALSTSKVAVSLSLSSSECTELRDFFNSLDLD